MSLYGVKVDGEGEGRPGGVEGVWVGMRRWILINRWMGEDDGVDLGGASPKLGGLGFFFLIYEFSMYD
jgi:hypothetical protein